MTDLELLELLEKAKEKQRGPQGPAGVGIDRIEQFEDDSFTIKLTTGESKKIQLPVAKDGEVGPPGIPGPSVTGPEGRRGPAGKDAAPARDGRDGAPGVSIDTGIVNADGQLLLGLSDGSRINVGNVRGPAGATGERGSAGLPGSPGRDGAAVLSGPRTPTQDDGEEGDHWINISSAEFSFYKKSGTGWTMLANLRQPGKNPSIAALVGGASGGGSGGGSAEVHVGPNSPNNPEKGAVWLDTSKTEPVLKVYDGTSWVLSSPSAGDLSEYAKTTYVDAQDNALGGRIDTNETALNNKASKADLATATAALPYTIETDKALRIADIEIKNRFTGEAAPMYAGGEIYLTDNLQFFSNVRFSGIGSITTSSDAQGIIIDGSALMPKNLLSLPELT